MRIRVAILVLNLSCVVACGGMMRKGDPSDGRAVASSAKRSLEDASCDMQKLAEYYSKYPQWKKPQCVDVREALYVIQLMQNGWRTGKLEHYHSMYSGEWNSNLFASLAVAGYTVDHMVVDHQPDGKSIVGLHFSSAADRRLGRTLLFFTADRDLQSLLAGFMESYWRDLYTRDNYPNLPKTN